MLLSEAIRKGIHFDCVACGDGDRRTMVGIIVHLRRDHGWSNPGIADWIAEQERRLGDNGGIMSEQVYVVRLTEDRFREVSQWVHIDARPEHPERQAALEELAGFLLQNFEFWATDHPGWHRVDAETVARLNGLLETLRALEPKP